MTNQTFAKNTFGSHRPTAISWSINYQNLKKLLWYRIPKSESKLILKNDQEVKKNATIKLQFQLTLKKLDQMFGQSFVLQ